MYEIDKQKFGAFVAALRKEKGYTQQELADMLYISNKAISKWETGVSIPDITLLIPLSEALNVSVTELLKYQRLPNDAPMDEKQVEDLLKTAITYTEEAQPKRSMYMHGFRIYLFCLLLAIAEVAVLYRMGFTRLSMAEPLCTVLVVCSVFGLYFMAFTIDKLPKYYDEYRISAFSDGPMRLNLPGVRISNRNWPHIVKVGRIWSMGMLAGYPLLLLIANLYLPQLWALYEKAVLLVLMLGGLFLPMIYVGRKYQ